MVYLLIYFWQIYANLIELPMQQDMNDLFIEYYAKDAH